jgi:putative ABC transport system permease protein
MEPNSVCIKLNSIGGTRLSRDQVNITAPLAERLGIDVGDMFTCINILDGKSYSLKIDGIVEAYGEQDFFMPFDEFNRITGQAPGSYRTVLSNHVPNYDQSLLAGIMDARSDTGHAV